MPHIYPIRVISFSISLAIIASIGDEGLAVS